MTEYDIFQVVIYTVLSGLTFGVVFSIIHTFFGRD